MGGLVWACVAPHGVALVPPLSDDADGGLATRATLEELGQRCTVAAPDVLIVATPHGMRVDGAICIAAGSAAAGTLRLAERQIEMHVPVDVALTDTIVAAAQAAGVPMARSSFGGNQRAQSVTPLDWGTMVPLWFLGHGRNLVGHGNPAAPTAAELAGPPVVIVTPSRQLPRSAMIAFGSAVGNAIRQDGRRVAFIASCDWAHTHRADGPYGFHSAAAEVDQLVVDALRANAPDRLLDLSEALVEAVAIDGLWQTLMLAGVMQAVPLHGDVLSYEAPTYFGMIVAAFEP